MKTFEVDLSKMLGGGGHGPLPMTKEEDKALIHWQNTQNMANKIYSQRIIEAKADEELDLKRLAQGALEAARIFNDAIFENVPQILKDYEERADRAEAMHRAAHESCQEQAKRH